MEITIRVPEGLPNETWDRLVSEVQEVFLKEGIRCEIQKGGEPSDDPWDTLEIDEIAVDTGVSDFAENHDQYLYGNAKRA
jgi:hypothetical protein